MLGAEATFFMPAKLHGLNISGCEKEILEEERQKIKTGENNESRDAGGNPCPSACFSPS